MKAKILSFAIALIALFAFNNAFAGNPHIVGSLSYTVVSCSGGGQAIQISGRIAGLGNTVTSADISLTGTYEFTYQCINPSSVQKGREKAVPGQSGSTDASAQGTFPVRNGRVDFTLSTCVSNQCNPNNWTFKIPANSVSLADGAFITVNGEYIYL